jgi:hypothetical protein
VHQDWQENEDNQDQQVKEVRGDQMGSLGLLDQQDLLGREANVVSLDQLDHQDQ